MLSLWYCIGFSLVAASGGHSPVAVPRLLISVASLVAGFSSCGMSSVVAAPELQSTGSVAVLHRLSCSVPGVELLTPSIGRQVLYN